MSTRSTCVVLAVANKSDSERRCNMETSYFIQSLFAAAQLLLEDNIVPVAELRNSSLSSACGPGRCGARVCVSPRCCGCKAAVIVAAT